MSSFLTFTLSYVEHTKFFENFGFTFDVQICRFKNCSKNPRKVTLFDVKNNRNLEIIFGARDIPYDETKYSKMKIG